MIDAHAGAFERGENIAPSLLGLSFDFGIDCAIRFDPNLARNVKPPGIRRDLNTVTYVAAGGSMCGGLKTLIDLPR